MNGNNLKQEIRKTATSYAKMRNLVIDDSHTSAILFRNLADSFHPDSFANIGRYPGWNDRIRKLHQNVSGIMKMQSSNSSNALLMNIFCHPSIQQWTGVKNLLNNDLAMIEFGVPGKVRLKSGDTDATEIDMVLLGVFCEAKLTELDFTRKRHTIVENYASLQTIFHVEELPRVGDEYDNYQIIRNLLAAIEHDREHILLCDERRPDLVRRYANTVCCLRDVRNRKRCRVIFWQEIAAVCGRDMSEWLKDKYGIG